MLGIYFMAFVYALYLGFSSKPEESTEVLQLKTSLHSVEQDAMEFKNRYEKMRSQLVKLETDLEKKTSELNAREPLIQSLKADLVTFQTSVSTKAAEAERRDQEITRLTAELEKANALSRESSKLKEALHIATTQAQTSKKELDQKVNEVIQKNFELQQAADKVVELKKAKEELLAKELLITQGLQEAKALKVDLEKARSLSQGSDDAKQKEIARLTAEIERTGNLVDETKRLKAALGTANAKAQELLAQLNEKNAELTKINAQLEQTEDIAVEAQQKVQELTADLSKAVNQPQTSLVNEDEFKKIETELKDMKDVLQIKIFELTAKDREIKKLKTELDKAQSGAATPDQAAYEARVAKLKSSESDILQIEKSLDEEKQALRAMKLRVSEGKMKLQLLNEKTKETVEQIAQFAEGKEFEEFRKSIHMDETIAKYEDEIKSLQIKVLELENRNK